MTPAPPPEPTASPSDATPSDRWTGVALLLATALLWSLAGVAVKVAGTAPLAFTSLRSAGAALAMLPLLGLGAKLTGAARPAPRLMAPVAACYAVMVGAFIVASSIGTAAEAILLQYSAPAWAALMAWGLLGRRISRAQLAALLTAALGVGVLLADVWGADRPDGPLAPCLAVLSGVGYAGVIVGLDRIDAEARRRTGQPANIAAVVLWNNLPAALALGLWAALRGGVHDRPRHRGRAAGPGRVADGVAVSPVPTRPAADRAGGGGADRADRTGAQPAVGLAGRRRTPARRRLRGRGVDPGGGGDHRARRPPPPTRRPPVPRGTAAMTAFPLVLPLLLAAPPDAPATLAPHAPVPAGMREAFVAVGYGGRRLVSPDGRTWEITAEWVQPGGDDKYNLMGLTFAEGRFVAVGGGGGGRTGAGHVLISENGRDWRQTLEAPNRVNPVLYNAGPNGGRFVAGGPGRTILISDDAGESWRDGAKLEAKIATHFRRGASGNGVFLLLGNPGGNGGPFWLAATPDGETVTHFADDLPNNRAIAFGDPDGPGGVPGRFVLVGPGGVRRSSEDGVTWANHDTGGGEHLTSLVWTGTEFLTGAGKLLASSPDGETWTAEPGTLKGNLEWSDGTRLIAVGWPGKTFYSPDRGLTWEQGDELPKNGLNAVTRGAVAAVGGPAE